MKRKNFPGRKDERRRAAIAQMEYEQSRRYNEDKQKVIDRTRAKLRD